MWLHEGNAGRPKWAVYRILRAGLGNLTRAAHLRPSDRLLLTKELCSALLIPRFRSKLSGAINRFRSSSRFEAVPHRAMRPVS